MEPGNRTVKSSETGFAATFFFFFSSTTLRLPSVDAATFTSESSPTATTTSLGTWIWTVASLKTPPASKGCRRNIWREWTSLRNTSLTSLTWRFRGNPNKQSQIFRLGRRKTKEQFVISKTTKRRQKRKKKKGRGDKTLPSDWTSYMKDHGSGFDFWGSDFFSL